MSEKKVKFRKSISGYNKEDVNTFIESLSSKYYEKETGYQKKISELEKKINELTCELESANKVNESELTELREKAEKSDALICELNGRLEELTGEKESLEKENRSLKVENEELNTQSSQFAAACEKSNMYDKVSEQIGSMIVSANAKAESIVKDAELRAISDRKAMINGAADRIRNMNEKYTGEIKSRSNSISDDLQRIVTEIERFSVESKMALELECREIKGMAEKDYTEALGEE